MNPELADLLSKIIRGYILRIGGTAMATTGVASGKLDELTNQILAVLGAVFVVSGQVWSHYRDQKAKACQSVPIKTIVAALASITLCGCATITNPQWLTLAASVARSATSVAVAADVRDNPDHATIYRLTENALTRFVDSTNWSAIELAGILSNLPVDEFRDPDTGYLFVSGAVAVFDAATGLLMNVETPEAVRVVALAIRDGINTGLGGPAKSARKAVCRPVWTVKEVRRI